MGGDGSGRQKETETGMDVLMNDEDFKAVVVDTTVRNYKIAVSTLMDIIEDRVTDQVFDSKNGKFVSRPVSPDTKVKAIKVLKELTLDKVVSDKKVVSENPNQGNLFDVTKAILDIEGAIEEAVKAKANKPQPDGKLSLVSEAQ